MVGNFHGVDRSCTLRRGAGASPFNVDPVPSRRGGSCHLSGGQSVRFAVDPNTRARDRKWLDLCGGWSWRRAHPARQEAPFGLHATDRKAALQYLQCCMQNNMAWKDAAEQIGVYLEKRGVSLEFTASQLEITRQKLQPWLD